MGLWDAGVLTNDEGMKGVEGWRKGRREREEAESEKAKLEKGELQ